jgi:DNA-binding beta-propeller fold protein YncE
MNRSGLYRFVGVFTLVFLAGLQSWIPLQGKEPLKEPGRVEPVGRVGENRYITPTGQILTPAGRQVNLPGMRPQALALSPDGRLLVTSGKGRQLVVIDPATGEILQKVSMPSSKAIPEPATEKSEEPNATEDPDAQPARRRPGRGRSESGAELSLTGLTFSPDGTRIYLSAVGGNIKVFAVDKMRVVTGLFSLPLPDANAPKRKAEVPAGLAVSADGKRLYVVGNLGNKLHELNTETGAVLRSWDVGVSPFDVVLASGKAYVSNSGGRRPGEADLTGPAGKGTTVRVDPVRYIASEGSVSVIDLASGNLNAEIVTGLHASDLAVSPNGRYVVVADAGSDTLSVISTRSDRLVEKIWTRQSPADLFGAQPNALAFDRGGWRLFVCNGSQNAVAVIQFDPADKESRLLGLVPVGWFPGAVVFHPQRKEIYVANIKGIGAAKDFKPEEKVKLNSKDFYGTLSLVPLPSEKVLPAMTQVALDNMRYPRLAEARRPARPNQPARPVPERTGEPSVFKHVIYVIKENRSYDQILGDMMEGNGNAELCTFGEKYTPNQHQIAREFILLDNTYCAGVRSADGHQWTDSAIANDYMERQITADFPRSYPGGKDEVGLDALGWSSSGFIWDHVLAQGKTFRNYGEWMITESGWKDAARKDKPRWQDFWKDYQTGAGAGAGLTRIGSWPGIPSLRDHSNMATVGWDLRVPDVMRAAEFIKELKQFEARGGFPDLLLLFLPNDHTGGTRGQSPTPGAQVADNDLALGQVVEALTQSKFWPETCLFAIEDDPQAGWDHVSGYRTTCYVVSPYTKRRQTISTQYNQTSLMRTMELILGVGPMNQFDAVAMPMIDCFSETADLTPYTAVPNQIPLDQLNARPRRVSDQILRRDAFLSERLPLDEPDACPEDVLNRILWHAMKGSQVPYPEWAVSPVADLD